MAKGVVNDASTWHMDGSAVDDVLLVFASGGTGDWQLLWMDRGSKQISTVADKLTNLQIAKISPQGDRIALQIDTGVNDIWVLDVARGIRTRLTFGPVSNTTPVWSPDGKWIVYNADRNGHSNLCRKPSDGGGAEEILLTDDQITVATDWSRDGKYLFYSRGPVGSQEVWALPLEGERKPSLVVPRARTLLALRAISPRTAAGWHIHRMNPVRRKYMWCHSTAGKASGRFRPMEAFNPSGAAMAKNSTTWTRAIVFYVLPVKDTGGALQFGSAQQLVSNWSAPQVFYDIYSRR